MQNIIQIPEDLARELDILARAEHKRRTLSVIDLLWRDIQRNKQRQFVRALPIYPN